MVMLKSEVPVQLAATRTYLPMHNDACGGPWTLSANFGIWATEFLMKALEVDKLWNPFKNYPEWALKQREINKNAFNGRTTVTSTAPEPISVVMHGRMPTWYTS